MLGCGRELCGVRLWLGTLRRGSHELREAGLEEAGTEPHWRALRRSAQLCVGFAERLKIRTASSREISSAEKPAIALCQLLSQSRAARCACAISASVISKAISRLRRIASVLPRMAARLNHLCADT